MPGYNGHLVAWGVVGGLALALVSSLIMLDEYSVLGFVLGFGVTLLPDLDAKKSKIRALFDKFLLITIILSGMLAAVSDPWFVNVMIAAAATYVLFGFTKHRGKLHNPLAALIITSPLWMIHIVVYVFGILAYATHIYLDLVSTSIKRRF